MRTLLRIIVAIVLTIGLLYAGLLLTAAFGLLDSDGASFAVLITAAGIGVWLSGRVVRKPGAAPQSGSP
jgi:hypothetical protein